MNEESNTEHILEYRCIYCRGKGYYREEGSGRWRSCGMCNGSGYEVSDEGQRILDLISHNMEGSWTLRVTNDPSVDS